MEQAAQELAAFVASEPTMHKLLPWHELSPEQLSELYKQADDRGKATMIAGQIRMQVNLYVDGWTLTLFWRILMLFGTLKVEEVDEEFFFNQPPVQPLPKEIAAKFWMQPDPKVIFKSLDWRKYGTYRVSTSLGYLVSRQWKQALPRPTVKHLEREVQAQTEGFLELLQETFSDLWESTFYRTLSEAYNTPRCTNRELIKVLDRKLHIQMNAVADGLRGEARKHYRESKKRYFDSHTYQRDTSPERMNHQTYF